MPEPIGFIGLGHMGLPIAHNLLSAGFPLRVYNRSAGKAKPLIEAGATLVTSPAEVATPGGIIITMLADDVALESVATDDLANALGRGGVHISMSTVSPETNAKLEDRFARSGAAVIAAPVFGRPEAAGAGKLWVCTSGPTAPKQRVKPVLDVVGQGVFDFGTKVGSANVVKLAGNFMLTAATEAMAEASALAEKNGIPRESLLKMLTQTLFNCPVYNGYAARIIDADFEKVGFALPLALKDMLLARQTATSTHAPMPYLDILCDRYISAIAKGRSGLDASAVAQGAAEDAGLKWGA
ncbi:MAG TPA: NAD(P)-dependent oxidoreductase [Tepidisphaeraceae bacterium]|nr:NAD(P)-dependent oxidoreductase [Tepidisphaeraceae bacterium]